MTFHPVTADAGVRPSPRTPASDRHPLPRLMLVTDRARCAPRDLVEVVNAAVEGGVELVQLREKDLSARELLVLARRLREASAGHARLLINDRVDIALACDADGVHLSESGFPVALARDLWSASAQPMPGIKMIGRSVHTAAGARTAEDAGADYLVAGTIFATGSHPQATPQGLDFLREVCAAATIPVFAIGGVTRANARACVEAGAHGVAVIGAIMGADDVARAARELLACVCS